jgi:hypothetical protein
MEFKELYDTMLKPTRGLSKAWTAGMSRLNSAVKVPVVPVKSAALRGYAGQLGRLIWRFNFAVNKALIQYREPVLDMQLVQERIATVAMEMFASACTLSRLDSELQAAANNGGTPPAQRQAAELFLTQSLRRMRQALAGMTDNDDREILATADAVLGKTKPSARNGS